MNDDAMTANTDQIAVVEFGSSVPKSRRLRYGILGFLSLVFLAGWGWFAWYVYDTYMPRLELSRLMGVFMAQGMGGGGMSAEEKQQMAQEVQLATTVAEAVRHSWFVLMMLVELVLLIAGLVGVFGGRRSRGWLLTAGFGVLLGTIATLVGIVLLIKLADFPATITPAAYAILTIGQSSFGWILILLCRHPRRTPY